MVTIRLPKDSEYQALAELSGQLGYSCNAEEFKRRYEHIKADPAHVLFVAELSGKVVGWVHVRLHRTLIHDQAAEIAALIVDANERGNKIGLRLMEQAESWIRSNGVGKIWLRSNVKREDTHRFYQRLGYDVRKTSHKFEKIIG